ncbi:MAG: pilus assembly PilX N-terminal domain-containing protein [Thiohalobacterales bacterium]|nr:pilus assembly PilX N-terminal domain-containing protein [Thiohalobacterales bacterium]
MRYIAGEYPPVQHTPPGAALPLAMLCLAVLTLLGVAGMQGGRLELLQAGNRRAQHDALAGAEYVLAAAERAAMQLVTDPFSPDITGDPYYPFGSVDLNPSTPAVSDRPTDRQWDFGHADVRLPDLDDNGVDDDGSGAYIIEDAGLLTIPGEDASIDGRHRPLPGARMQVLRITARSVHTRGARRLVQSLLVREPLPERP